MMTKKEIQDWLESLPEDAMVYVADDGLTLSALDDEDRFIGWLEVGGHTPEEDL